MNEILSADPASPVPAELVRRLADAVAEAGRLAHRMFGEGVRSWHKANASPVCDADIAVDALLRERLTALIPDAGWLSEEMGDPRVREAHPCCWIVDPIDGTRAFLSGLPDWVVAAALVERGRPIAAAVHAPATAELFVAAHGRGATRNGAPIAAAAANSFSGVRVAGPKPMVERIVRAGESVVHVPRIPSLALRLVRAATGELDIALASGDSHDWDLAAADLLVHEAGGVMTGLDGNVPRYDQPEPVHGPLAAAGRSLHPLVLRTLAAEPRSLGESKRGSRRGGPSRA